MDLPRLSIVRTLDGFCGCIPRKLSGSRDATSELGHGASFAE
jgi:hypothetical protein